MNPWIWKMAWRDSRRGRARLLLFSSALTLGVTALVAIGTLRSSLERAIDAQARSLVGADLVLEGRAAPSPEQAAFEGSLGGTTARETALSSMARFPRSGATRLVQVRAVEGAYPFYGQVETDPPAAAEAFRAGRGALIEDGLRAQFAVQPGDAIEIGGRAFPVLGGIRKLPGETAAFSGVAPRVLIPRADLPVGLLARGSLVRWKTYFRLPETVAVPDLIRAIKPQLTQFRLDADDVARRKRSLGRVFENMSRFLNLVGFVALLLGGIGVASAIQAHLKGKLRTVATLRCLGASSRQALAIYLIQAVAMGAAGALAGALLGLLVGAATPRALAGVLPVKVEFLWDWSVLGQGIAVGLVTCVLFALLPLLPVRRVPPLLALRAAFDVAGADAARGRRRDPLLWLTLALLTLALTAFPAVTSRDWRFGLWFSGFLLIAFLALAAVARSLIWGARRFFPRSWPYAWRQGVANLYRPNNRTLLLTFTLGLSTFLLLGLELTKDALLRQFASRGSGNNQPNLVFFDVQSDQKAAVAELVRAGGLPVLDLVPVVTMRLASLKGRPVEEILSQSPKGKGAIPEWRLRHEYRSTYRDRLTDGEEITGGRWTGRFEPAPNVTSEKVPVSIEAEAARELQLQPGDDLVFNVGGVLIATTVGSVRKVEWERFQPNFFVVFPAGGTLEEAPAFHVLVTRARDAAQSGAVQSAMVQAFPNVAAIDLSLIVGTVQNIVDKATWAVRVLSIFTVGTGLLVLAAAILTGRYERLQESVLLRTLGASRGVVFTVLCVEYLALGALAALTGAVLAVAGSWALTTFVFKISWSLPVLPLALSLVLAAGLTLLIGLLASRGVCDQPPLEILRAEG